MKYNFDEIIDRKNTNSVKYDKLKHYFGKDDLLPFWVADTDFNVPQCISDAIINRANHAIYGYSFRGNECIKSVQNWLKNRHNWIVNEEWVSSSPGVVTALSLLLMSLTEKGDKIAVQPPVYHPFFHVVNDTGRTLVHNPLIRTNNSYKMDFEHLEQLAKEGLKAIIISNPHNPVGRVWTKDELLKLGELAAIYDFLIISDEIHQDLIYKKHKHIVLASLSDDLANRTITCIAPSKTFNVAGLASSVIIIPNQQLKKTYEKLLCAMHLDSGNLFGHVAMQAGYEHGADWLEQLLDYLQGNVDFVRDFLEKNIPEIKLVEPEATYLLWLDCRKLGISSEKLNQILIEKGNLALNKGTTFGKEGNGYMRLNIGCPNSMLREGLEILSHTIKNLKKL
ncbi:MAG: pyridoxal phosphate-dependent aminotransferase [Marinifilum sp.]|jgi:cystathionine beta-lyase|nr:pyridoxal phosphate-dependent aminotransferase [Marinifilum sp.]